MLRITNIRALLPEGVLDNAFIDIDDGMICAIGQAEKRSPKRLSEHPTVHPSASIIDTQLGAWTEVGADTSMVESSMDDYSYIVQGCQVIYTTIGKFCSIASYARLNPGNHPIDRPTSSHMTYRAAQYGFALDDEQAIFDWRRAHPVTIGHDVWIGHNVSIMPGVTVGRGAVIGTGAVVTKDIPAYSIAVGVPATVIRPRFPDEVIEKLEKIQWWNWSRQLLEERFLDFRDMDSFLEKYA